MDTVTILIIDDHPLFRQGVAKALLLESDFRVFGEASNGMAGLDLIRNLQPNVAIVDINLPEMNGQQVARHVVVEKLATRVILFTAYDDVEQELHAISVGAAAYCTKDIPSLELVRTIRAVNAGKYVVRGQVYDREKIRYWIVDQMNAFGRDPGDLGKSHQPLSPREMEVLGLIIQGMSNKEIAVQLGISQQTVKNHITAVLRKLDVEDRTQAAVFALRRGWVR